MWHFLLACAPSPPPAPAHVAPWRLVGRASSEGLDTPSLPGGSAALGQNCGAVNAALGGDGPPCAIEVWRAGEREVRVERAGQQLRLDGAPGRTAWSQLRGSLAECLGDPLLLPPAGDPGGQRRLVDDQWRVELSGENRCRLAGVLRLDVRADRADWSGLTANGRRWADGGRAFALEVHRAQLRKLTEEQWDSLGTDERSEVLTLLRADPSPEAQALVARLDATIAR